MGNDDPASWQQMPQSQMYENLQGTREGHNIPVHSAHQQEMNAAQQHTTTIHVDRGKNLLGTKAMMKLLNKIQIIVVSMKNSIGTISYCLY